MPKFDWDMHRDRIQAMYATMSLQDLMVCFKDDFGLEASKSSWERRLKEWGFRKYSRQNTASIQSTDSDDARSDDESGQGLAKDILSSTPSKSPWAMFLKSLEARQLLETFNQCFDSADGLVPVTTSTRSLLDMELILPPRCPGGNGYLLAQLYILANNHHEAPMDQPNQTPAAVMAAQDYRIVNLLDRMSHQLTSLLSSPDPITEAIRDSAFASALRTHRLALVKHVASIGVDRGGVDLDGLIRTAGQKMETPLQFAAEVQDEARSLEMIEILLNLGARTSLPQHSEKLSPLYRCIDKQHYRAATLLVRKNAAVGPGHILLSIEKSIRHDAEIQVYPTPLVRWEFTSLLLGDGSRINKHFSTTSRYPADVTPLGQVIMEGKLALAGKLLDFGADPNAPQKTNCFRLLSSLGKENHVTCTETVTTTCLGLAIALGEIAIARLLLNRGGCKLDALPFERYRSPLLIACAHAQTGIAMDLISKGTDVAVANDAAKRMECIPISLELALCFGCNWAQVSLAGMEVLGLRHLLFMPSTAQAPVANLGSFDTELSSSAAHDMVTVLEMQHIDLVEQVIRSSGLIPRQLGKVLSAAIIREQFHLVRPLLDNGAVPDGDPAINPSDRMKLTAWDASLRSRDTRVVEAMILAGADPGARSRYTLRTPVQIAVEGMDPEVLACLIRHGADVNAPATESVPTTALQHAAIQGHTKLVEMLLDADADVNALADAPLHGRTALEGAAERGRMEVVHLLIRKGIRKEARVQGAEGNQCERAISFAEKEGHNALARWLRSLLVK